MKFYLVIEGAGLGPPNDHAEIVYGAFSSQEKATECMERHARYWDRVEGRPLTRAAGRAEDKHGNVYIQIVTLDLDHCRKETVI